jgi:hypothetical protein
VGVQGDDAIATAGAVASIASQQIQTLTDDLLAAARSNRKLFTDLVQFEVDRGASQLARLDPQQLEGLLSAVRRLADDIAALAGVSRSKAAAPTAEAPANRTKAANARPLSTKKTAKKTAKKATKKAAPKKADAKATTAKPTAAKKATKKAAKKAPAKAPEVTSVAPGPLPAAVLAPEPVIDITPEPKVDPGLEAVPEPILETVPQTVGDAAERSTESDL